LVHICNKDIIKRPKQLKVIIKGSTYTTIWVYYVMASTIIMLNHSYKYCKYFQAYLSEHASWLHIYSVVNVESKDNFLVV